MPRGSAPGERRGGRAKGTPNRLSIGRMKAEVASSATQLDALDQLRQLADTFRGFIEAELAKPKPSRDYLFACYDRVARILEKIVPYQRPKLQAITVAGVSTSPPRVPPDLSRLSDEELDQLEKIVLKVGAGHTAAADRDAYDARREYRGPRRAALTGKSHQQGSVIHPRPRKSAP
jgi:hypothetical protein